tara:strand:+ start:1220 stop:3694 length:2475 start_codon:yes stop_codon:yes gene_type:complete
MSNISIGYSDGDVDTNDSGNRSLNAIADERYSRRQTMVGGLRASAAAVFGSAMLSACDFDLFGGDDEPQGSAITVNAGADGTTTSGNYVTLEGSVTGGTGGNSWTQVSGVAVDLILIDQNSVSFLAPAVASPTPLTFRFSAENGAQSDETVITVNPAALNFDAVAKNLDDVVTVPTGYTASVLTALGDPIIAGTSAYANDGTDTDFDGRIGDHGDALHFFGLNDAGQRDYGSSTRGILVQNHENITETYLHPNGPTNLPSGPRPASEAIKEIECHGLSFTEVRDDGNRAWSYVQDSAFNRRVTPNTPTTFNGPVSGTSYLRTKFSPSGTAGRGTINNCANGYAAWGTIMTCEENWAGYFKRPSSGAESDEANRSQRELTALARYGVRSSDGNYAWSSATPTQDIFTRWDARAGVGAATDDYRNEPNQFGWVVEIDPYNPNSTPRKRTALGRFGHEGAWMGKLTPGQKVTVYMGDDSRREYLYKFVSDTNWDAADELATDRLAVGDKYLDSGTLYVAKFDETGNGTWLPLVFGQVPNRPATSSDPEYVFESQADILVNPRLAADAVGATPMDRPEWTAVNPVNGEVYLTLTNNNAANRALNDTGAANPRHYNDPKGTKDQYGNPNGHIIRLREAGDDGAATSFAWDIYLFGSDSADADQNVNISGLTADNDFSSPDGLWFSREQNAAGQINPLLWIQTDDSALTDRSNCMMLAALPGEVGDGGNVTITNKDSTGATAQQTTIVGAAASAATLKRFLVGPVECEITGVDSTPDGRTLFVGIQHPGERGTYDAPTSNWPQSQGGTASGRPRSAVVVVTRDNSGIVGL